MKFVSFLLACAIFAVPAGCRRKPAYSNINVNGSRGDAQSQASAQQPKDGESAATPAAGQPADQPAGTAAVPPQQPPAQPTTIKMPAFFDGQTGEVKDLPSYPKSQRMSIQYGPTGPDTEMASLVLGTSGTMDSIAAFYDKAIKAGGWTITERNRDPDFSEWRLKKGDKDEGRVVVKRDPAQGAMTIQIVRTSKAPEKK